MVNNIKQWSDLQPCSEWATVSHLRALNPTKHDNTTLAINSFQWLNLITLVYIFYSKKLDGELKKEPYAYSSACRMSALKST